MAPEPRALKPQFPGDVAVAGGFIFWQSVPIYTGMEGVLIVSGVLSCPPSLLHVSAVRAEPDSFPSRLLSRTRWWRASTEKRLK